MRDDWNAPSRGGMIGRVESVGEQRRRAPEPSRLELLIVRLLNLPVILLFRTLDVLLLLVRPSLLWRYLEIWLAEWLHPPYRYPRHFEAKLRVKRAQQTLDELVYGELPVFSGTWLLWRAGFGRGSRLLDLCAGRGLPLMAASLRGGEARGIELMETHVAAASRLLARSGIVLEQGDAKSAVLGEPTHVFLNWCGLTSKTREAIEQHVRKLPGGTIFMAVGMPLNETDFPVVSKHRLLFSWGRSSVYVQRKASPAQTPPGHGPGFPPQPPG